MHKCMILFAHTLPSIFVTTSLSLSLFSTEIDSDEPYRDPAMEVSGCNEESNADARSSLRERVQRFLAEYVEYTGLSTGSGSES